MFDLFNGLPVHPLVVHGVAVLVPLAVLATIAIAVRPAWRTRYGHLVIAVSAVGTALIPIATESGEALERRVGDPGEHAELGDQLLWFALPMLILAIALVVLERRRAAGADSIRPAVFKAVAVLAIVSSVACAVQVYRVGDSGARAAWADKVTTP